MKNILKQNISNHPLFPNIKREVEIKNISIQSEFNQIVLEASINYFDVNQNDKNVTSAFNSKLQNWIVNNNDYTTVRDAKGKPVANPQYKEAPSEGEDERTPEQKEPYMKAPSFDYFFSVITNPKSPSLINLLQLHIQGNDAIKFFDKMLNIPIEDE